MNTSQLLGILFFAVVFFILGWACKVITIDKPRYRRRIIEFQKLAQPGISIFDTFTHAIHYGAQYVTINCREFQIPRDIYALKTRAVVDEDGSIQIHFPFTQKGGCYFILEHKSGILVSILLCQPKSHSSGLPPGVGCF
jgi:hypothetical protein